MNLAYNVALAPRTTLGLGGPAKRLASVSDADELAEALRSADADQEPVLILGGGSNLVIGDAGWNGLVIELTMPEIRIAMHSDTAIVSAGAGATWDSFVAAMVDANLVGIECLSGIPGKVGATPMQNVGAYGQEVADTIGCIRAYDRQLGTITEFFGDDCDFGYRTSVFRRSARWVILEVQFQFSHSRLSAPIRYPELARTLCVEIGERAPLAETRQAVLALRRSKAMIVDSNDPDSRSAGSFFTNPIVEASQLVAMQSQVADAAIPHWPMPNGSVKLSAAWLIERAGFAKGHVHGNVGLSSKHSLALINRGGASTAELLGFATKIQRAVERAFGVALVPEPIFV